MKYFLLCTMTFFFLLSVYAFSDVSPNEKRLLEKQYSLKRLEAEEDAKIALDLHKKALIDRPIQLKERRWAIVPLVYMDEVGSVYSYGLDLPEPLYDWVALKEESSAFPKGTLKLKVIKVEDAQCWGLLLYNPKWNKVPPHGSVVVLTIPAFVNIPK